MRSSARFATRFPATPARSLSVDTAILIVAGAVYLGMLLGGIPGLALDRTGVAGQPVRLAGPVRRGAKWRRPRGCC